MVRRRAFLAVGGFEESFRGLVADLVFGKFCLRYSVYVSDECWDRYRQRAGSVRQSPRHREQVGQRNEMSWVDGYRAARRSGHRALRAALRAALRRSTGLITGGRESSGYSGAPLWCFQF